MKTICIILFLAIRSFASDCVSSDLPYPTCQNASARPEWNQLQREIRSIDCELPKVVENVRAAHLAWRRAQITPKEFGNLSFHQPVKSLEVKFQELDQRLRSNSKGTDWTAFERERERQMNLIKIWDEDSEINHRGERRYLRIYVQYLTTRLKKTSLEISKSFALGRIESLKKSCEEGSDLPSPTVTTK